MARLSECIKGAVFSRLTVEHMFKVYENNRNKNYVQCICTCGNTVKVRVDGLGTSNKSCGCLNSELVRINGKKNATHGMRHTSTYKSWVEMWARTTYKNHIKYDSYKHRTPPEEWRDFAVFYKDMGEKPEGYSLERIRNDLPYGPDNCKWVPKADQGSNTSRVRRFVLDGVEYNLRGLENKFKISHGAMSYRLYTNKEPLHSILNIQEDRLIEMPKR